MEGRRGGGSGKGGGAGEAMEVAEEAMKGEEGAIKGRSEMWKGEGKVEGRRGVGREMVQGKWIGKREEGRNVLSIYITDLEYIQIGQMVTGTGLHKVLEQFPALLHQHGAAGLHPVPLHIPAQT